MRKVFEFSGRASGEELQANFLITPEEAFQFKEAYIGAGHELIKKRLEKAVEPMEILSVLTTLLKNQVIPALYPLKEVETSTGLDPFSNLYAELIVFISEYVEAEWEIVEYYLQNNLVVKIDTERLYNFKKAYIKHNTEEVKNRLTASDTSQKIINLILEMVLEYEVIPILWPVRSHFDGMYRVKPRFYASMEAYLNGNL